MELRSLRKGHNEMQHERQEIGECVGLLWTWWRGDELPELPVLPSSSPLFAAASHDVETVAELLETTSEVIEKRLQEGQRAYLATVETNPVAVGWSITGQAGFGGGRKTFHVPVRNCYLYDFVTHPSWRGRGIYPCLMQDILRIESIENERFWIIHHIDNTASEQGIRKAGFQRAGEIHELHDGSFVLFGTGDRASEGAKVLDMLVTLTYP